MLKIVGALAIAALVIFLVPVIGTFTGMITGFTVNLFFPHTSAMWLQQFGLTCKMWQLGAMLGFAGGFFKSTTITRKSAD